MVVDADMHFNEAEGTWDRVDPERRLVMRDEPSGRRWICLGDRKLVPVRRTFPGEVDEARELAKESPTAYEELVARRRRPARSIVSHPAESDAVERLRVLDAMEVDEALLFPSYGLFWPGVVPDPEIADANFAGWNDWIAELTSIDPVRLRGVAQYSLADVDRATAEIRRCRKLGLAGMFFRAVPYRGLPWGDPSNEPVWAALEEENLPLLLHAAPVGPLTIDPAWEKGLPPEHVGQPIPTYLNRALPAEAVLTSLIFEGVLERHPRLRIGMIEFGSTWVPSFLERIDFAFEFLGPRNRYLRDRLSLRPSDYLRRQVKITCFWSEPLEWLFASAGSELFMFASDFPHPEGNEHAITKARNKLARCDEGVRSAFFADNAQFVLRGEA